MHVSGSAILGTAHALLRGMMTTALAYYAALTVDIARWTDQDVYEASAEVSDAAPHVGFSWRELRLAAAAMTESEA